MAVCFYANPTTERGGGVGERELKNSLSCQVVNNLKVLEPSLWFVNRDRFNNSSDPPALCLPAHFEKSSEAVEIFPLKNSTQRSAFLADEFS